MYVHLKNTSELCHGNWRSFTSNARWWSHPVIFTHHKFTLKSAKVRIAYSLGEPGRKILNYTVVAHSIGNVKKQAAGHVLVQPPTDRTAASYWHEERAPGTHTDAPQVKPHHTVKPGQLVCIMSIILGPWTLWSWVNWYVSCQILIILAPWTQWSWNMSQGKKEIDCFCLWHVLHTQSVMYLYMYPHTTCTNIHVRKYLVPFY